MIEFSWSRVDKKNNNTPVIKDCEIDEWAQAILQDYKPRFLKEPGKIRYQHFLESYLGAIIEFFDIFNDDPEHPILGATAFNHEELKVFDRENMCTRKEKVRPRTVVIDNSVVEDGKEGLALFTGLHEGGHLWMHHEVYTTSRLDQLSFLPGDDSLSPVVCCRQGSIENFATGKSKRTAKEWREHQADYFAAAIAMPNVTFLPAARLLIKEQGVSEPPIVIGADPTMDCIAEAVLPRLLSDIYGVSKKAASIKLKKCGFVTDQQRFRERSAQATLL